MLVWAICVIQLFFPCAFFPFLQEKTIMSYYVLRIKIKKIQKNNKNMTKYLLCMKKDMSSVDEEITKK